MKEQKIIVIGCSGAGKTTFAKQLAELLKLPLYHLDNIYWLPDATHLERPAFLEKQREIMQGERWIIDGNYRGTVANRIEQCELAFFFDVPVSVCLKGVRTREKKRDDIACELEPDGELLRDIRLYPLRTKPKLLKLFKAHPEVKVITFKSRREADKYLDNLRREYGLNI